MRFALVFDSPTEQGGWMPQRENILSQIGEVETVCSEMIMDGCLQDFDAVVFPGGIASFYGLKKWGNDFALAVRFFVATGGGYLGICGGAYIAIEAPAGIFGVYCNRTLALIDAQGSTPGVPLLASYIAFLDQLFPEFVEIETISHPIISGHQGELLEFPWSGGPGFFNLGETVTILARYRELEWQGQAALIASTFGQGRVVLCGPHPETPWDGLIGEAAVPWLYPRMATYVAERAIRTSFPLLPWAKPKPLPGGLPIMLGAGALTIGMVAGMKMKGRYNHGRM